MYPKDYANLERIANALENIAHELSKPKQNTSEFRIAALRRISTAVNYIDGEITWAEDAPHRTVNKDYFIGRLQSIRSILTEN